MEDESTEHSLGTASRPDSPTSMEPDLCEFCLELVEWIARPIPDGSPNWREFVIPAESACCFCEDMMQTFQTRYLFKSNHDDPIEMNLQSNFNVFRDGSLLCY